MKVLVATHSYSGNGAAVMLLAVLEHWIRDLKWTVDVLLGMEHEVPAELVRIGANVFPTAAPQDYDFALVNTVVSGHFLETLAPHVPTVLWVHEGETVLWATQMTSSMWRQVFELPKRIIFQGPWQSEVVFRPFLLRRAPGTFSCVRNGLPAIPAKLTPKARPSGKVRIIFVGGVYGRKRPNDLIDAVLALDRPDIECLFVGPIEDIGTIGEAHVALLKANPERFKLAGELDRHTTLEYLLSADIFCLPSGDESQPIAPLEAASLGVPCLLSDLPAYTGTWKHGQNCLLHPVGDATMLRWNLRAALEDPGVRSKVIAGGTSLVDSFSIEAFYKRFDAELPVFNPTGRVQSN